MKRKLLLSAGGDRRELAAAGFLAAEYDVRVTGIAPEVPLPEGVGRFLPEDGTPDILLLPMPPTSDGVTLRAPLAEGEEITLAGLIAPLPAGTPVLGGRMSPALCKAFADRGLLPVDYAKDEAFAVRNAVPTAEGAIGIAIRELPVTLHGTKVLLLGAGRISQALQPRLRALGAEVTVAARRCSDLARSEGGKGKLPGARAGISLRSPDRNLPCS